MTVCVEPAVGNEMFVHNLRALWRVDPQLALRLDQVEDDERLPLEPTRSGAWTARMDTPAGQPVYLHSRYDPVADASRFADNLEIEDKFCFVVGGFGLGYHVLALFERLRGDAFILCTEPSLRLLATALSCVDLADALASGRMIILTDSDKARLHERLKEFSTLMMLGAQFVVYPPARRVDPTAQEDLQRSISEFCTFTRISLLTIVANSEITCRNIAMNLTSYVSTPPLELLRDRFAGVPALIISAGPSLGRHLDMLAQAQGKAVLCSVQTTLKPLRQHGITPDFVTSLDFHEMSRKFFEGVDGLEQVHLVAEPKATWHVLDNYPGPLTLLHSHWAALLLGEELAARDGLKPGATVSHLAFYLALYMGCDPIIFVGQDLAFTGHVFYVPGVEIHRAWLSELNRFNTMEMKEWDRIVRNRPILHQVPGLDGGTVYTDELLLTYLEQFEKDIASTPRRIINATEGGAAIRGTEAMPLAEALARFCATPIDPERFAYRKTTRWHDPAPRVPAARELSTRLVELEDVFNVCDEMLVLLEELKGLIDDPARFNKRLIRVDELRARVYQSTRAYRIVNSATQLAELRRFSADRQLGAAETDDRERARRQLARDTEFITGVREGAIKVKDIIERALTRLEAEAPGS